MFTDTEVNLFTRVISELPLVVAFVFFSLRIIDIYQKAQDKQAAMWQAILDKQAATFETAHLNQSNSTAEMVKTITTQWGQSLDKRDQEMQKFLSEVRNQDKQILGQVIDSMEKASNSYSYQAEAFARFEAELISAERTLLPELFQRAAQVDQPMPAKPRRASPKG